VRCAFAEVGQHVIAIEADAMAGMNRSGRPADQHGTREQVLKMAFRREQTLPVRKVW
jgi:hypothetical protein